MKAATVKQIKDELTDLNREELITTVLRLSKFKKENKELLTYLLFESQNEESYIHEIELEMDILFDEMNVSSYFYMKKTIRKILKLIKTYIRYSNVKETEIELSLYFCQRLGSITPSIRNNQQLMNLYYRELKLIEKRILTLHEDLQYDYNESIKKLSIL